MNNLERYSRRNNVRLAGYPETRGENTHDIVDKIFKEKFQMHGVELERVHRAGKHRQHRTGNYEQDRPRHILIKLLRYQDKVEITGKQDSSV